MVQPLWKKVWNKRKVVPCRGNRMSTGKERAGMEEGMKSSVRVDQKWWSMCRALLR